MRYTAINSGAEPSRLASALALPLPTTKPQLWNCVRREMQKINRDALSSFKNDVESGNGSSPPSTPQPRPLSPRSPQCEHMSLLRLPFPPAPPPRATLSHTLHPRAQQSSTTRSSGAHHPLPARSEDTATGAAAARAPRRRKEGGGAQMGIPGRRRRRRRALEGRRPRPATGAWETARARVRGGAG